VREPREAIEEEARDGLRAVLGRHPVLTAVFVTCTLAGAGLGFALLSDDWSALRRIAAGGVAGAGSALLVTATRMFG
jgi:hypothetical protein